MIMLNERTIRFLGYPRKALVLARPPRGSAALQAANGGRGQA
jgi:hypothetical protein